MKKTGSGVAQYLLAGLALGAVAGLVWRGPIVLGLFVAWRDVVGPAFETLLQVDLPYC